MEPRRTLFVTSNFPRWSGDSTTPFVLHLAQDLAALGWPVDVLAPHAPGAATDELLDGVAVHRFRYMWPESAQTVCYGGGALVNLRGSPSAAAQVPALVAAEWGAVRGRVRAARYAIVHSHWTLPQGFVTELARTPPVRHVLTVHGGDIFALRGAVLQRFKRAALRGADAVTVNSSATEQAVRQVAPDLRRLARIPMGTTVAGEERPQVVADVRRRFRSSGGPLLLFVGRLVREKGIEDAVAALAGLVGRRPDATLVLAGAGQDAGVVQPLARRLGVGEKVFVPGWVDPADVPSWMRAADVVLVPSRPSPDGWVEAQGLTVAEALGAGRPVVASRVGGIPDAVRDGETGLLVPPGTPDAIAAAVDRLCTDTELASRLAAQGQALARQEFSREGSARRFAQLYAELLDGSDRATTAPRGRR